MRLLFVVQRYGHEVAGGAELACRELATRQAARGHAVSALTTCATSYVDWHNVYPPGREVLDGVVVYRLPVARARDNGVFGPLDARVAWGAKPVARAVQREWMRMQGPLVPQLPAWLAQRAAGYDVVVFFTYLYYTTWAGLPAAAGLVPTVLHPTAHDEPPLYLSLFDETFRLPTAFGLLTAEERDLLWRRFRFEPEHEVIGVGVELPGEPSDTAAVEGFRRRHGLGDAPFLLYVGRLDPGKGSDELYDHFLAYKRRRPGDLKLVLLGDPVKPVAAHPDVVVTGFVDEAERDAALAGCLALVQPSYFESFSMVLTEAFAHRRPALVQGHCEVLAGHATRSGAGLPYRGYAEFEAAVDRVVESPGLRAAMGEAGRRYVERHYDWDRVMDRYEAFLERVAAMPPRRAG